MAFALTEFHAGLPSTSLAITTAGTQASGDQFGGVPACKTTMETLHHGFPELDVAQDLLSHQSSQITVPVIEDADIILVMERQQRSQVVRMLPSAQRKTFLLTQAARLSTWILQQEDLVIDGKTSLVDLLDNARGLAPYEDDLDVEDPHRTGGPSHSSMIAEVDAATHSIALLIRELAHPRP